MTPSRITIHVVVSAAILAGLTTPGQVWADEVVLPAAADNTMYSEAANDSNGGGNSFFAGRTDNGDLRRGLIQFDVSAIPPGSTVTSVTLTLYQSRTQGGTQNVSLYRTLASWGEGTSHAPGEEGVGAPATPGDATWVYRFFDTDFWATPGGQFAATSSATTSVAGQNGTYDWSSAGMIADVQAWVDNPAGNFGWVIRSNETTNKTAKRFESRQSTNSNQRPKLTVVFTPYVGPTGACCYPDGNCQIVSESACTGGGGIYHGDDTICDPNPCPQPPGACCLPSGGCTEITQADCISQSGSWQGPYVPCTPDPCAEPTTVMLAPWKDNTLYENAGGDISNGAGEFLYVSENNQNIVRRAAVHFDTTMIPTGATVTDVELTLYCSQAQGQATDVIAHRLSADWGEGTSNASGDEANGASATIGDATWLHTFYNTESWATPGGDFDPIASASVSIAGNTGFYTWTSPGLVSDVQAWVMDPNTNAGWLMIGYELGSGRSKQFASRESATTANWPMLTVTYVVQVATGACCFGDGSCTILSSANCDTQGGIYQGNDTSCTPNPCPPPTGACCFTDGSCAELTSVDCVNSNGNYGGDGTSCTPNPCPQPPPTGACCFEDATCQVLTETDCSSSGGSYQGDDSTCTEGLCPMGPLPPVPVPPENPITEPKRVLGKILFWDEQLSTDNTVACGTCHQPFRSTADYRHAVNPGLDGLFGTDDDVFGSFGVVRMDATGAPVDDPLFHFDRQVTGRIAPPVFSALWSHRAFYDGRAGPEFVDPQTGQTLIENGGALEAQAIGPPMSEVEMAKESRTWAELVTKLEAAEPMAYGTYLSPDMEAALVGSPSYPDLFAAAFGTAEISAPRIAYAIATYQRTLVPNQTPLDLGTMTAQQQQGLNVFLAPASKCTVCHPGPLFTDNSFRNIGVRPIVEDIGRQGVTGNPADAGRFKTPGLRNAGLRINFMHNGRHATLEDVIDFYVDETQQFPENKDPAMTGITITPADAIDLVEFLRNGLTDPRVASETFPFDRPVLTSELGDANRDGVVDADDFETFAGCLTGVDAGPVATGCERLDMEGDSDLDLVDFAGFQLRFAGN